MVDLLFLMERESWSSLITAKQMEKQYIITSKVSHQETNDPG